MRQVRWWNAALLGTILVLASTAGRSQDEKKGNGDKTMAAPLERKALDETVFKTLREVINQGADLYNSGDRAACYRLWEGSLRTIGPFLDHRPELQKAVGTLLTNAERNPDVGQRCFILREALDKIRAEANPNPKPALTQSPAVTKPKTMWEEMGGESGVKKIVDDLVEKVGSDPKVDFFRNGKYKPTAEELASLKKKIIDQISDITKGPYTYTGRTMRAAHMGMGITNDQFDAFVEDFKNVLETNKVKPETIRTILEVVGTTRSLIVEPKKPETKPEDKKDDKKPVGTASVTGKITLLGKPLSGGTITLHPEKGDPIVGKVAADGSYEIKDLKPGDYTVSVKTEDKDTKIPTLYGDPKTSPLKMNVKDGTQNFDHELK
jgi:hemoglobin